MSLLTPAEDFVQREVFDAASADPLAGLSENSMQIVSYSLTELLTLEPFAVETSARIDEDIALIVERGSHSYEVVRVDPVAREVVARYPLSWGAWDPAEVVPGVVVWLTLFEGDRESLIIMEHGALPKQALRLDWETGHFDRAVLPDLEGDALSLGGVVAGDRAWISDPESYGAILEWHLQTGELTPIDLGDDELATFTVWGTPDALISYARRGEVTGLLTITPEDGPVFTAYNNLEGVFTSWVEWLPDGRMIGFSNLEWTGLPGDLWQVYDPQTGEATIVFDGCETEGPYGRKIALPSGIWVIDVSDYEDYQLTRILLD